MSHCKSPQSCSVCLATPFRRVEIRDGVTYVDGEPVRAVQPALSGQSTGYSQRGGRATRGGPKRRR